MKRVGIIALLTLALLGVRPAVALADITVFWGAVPTVSTRATQGFSIGLGLLVVGFEFEYGATNASDLKGAPSLKTGMFNGVIMTPTPGFQLYVTAGGGLFREALVAQRTTSFATNIGGGVKMNLVGPVRLRLDYRVFHLGGSPVSKTEQRFYAGLNLRF